MDWVGETWTKGGVVQVGVFSAAYFVFGMSISKNGKDIENVACWATFFSFLCAALFQMPI